MNRNISIITINQFLTNTADSIFQVVLFWYVYNQTGSALSASLVTTINFTIQIFLSPLIGVLSDRFDPRRAMQLSFWILGIVGVIFAPVYFYFESYIIMYIYIALTIHTSCMMLEISSKNRLIPIFAGEENIIKTNGYISSTSNIAALIGNSVGGGILAVLSFAGVMLIHSGLYFLAGFLLLFLIKIKAIDKKNEVEKSPKINSKPSKGLLKKTSFFHEILEGLKLLKGNRPLLKLIILSSVLNIAMINSSLLVVLVSDHYKGSSTTYGMFNTFGVLSAIVIGLVISNLTSKFKASHLFTAGLFITGIATVLMGVTDFVVFGVILNMLVLASGSILRITFNSFLIIFVEDKFRGRVMSLAIAISAIVVPMVSLIGGYLSDNFSVGFVYILSGTWIFIWAFFPLFNKDIRSINLGVQRKQNATL